MILFFCLCSGADFVRKGKGRVERWGSLESRHYYTPPSWRPHLIRQVCFSKTRLQTHVANFIFIIVKIQTHYMCRCISNEAQSYSCWLDSADFLFPIKRKKNWRLLIRRSFLAQLPEEPSWAWFTTVSCSQGGRQAPTFLSKWMVPSRNQGLIFITNLLLMSIIYFKLPFTICYNILIPLCIQYLILNGQKVSIDF